MADSGFLLPPPVPAVSSIAAWLCEGEGGGPSPRRLASRRIKDAGAGAAAARVAGFFIPGTEKLRLWLLFASCTHRVDLQPRDDSFFSK